MAGSLAVCGQQWEAVRNGPRLQDTMWLLGSPCKREAPGSIWESSACLCYKHSLHKMKDFLEFYGSVYVKVSFAVSHTANGVGSFYQSFPRLEQWEPAQGAGLSKPKGTCSSVPGPVCGLSFVMVRLSRLRTAGAECVEEL